MDDRIISKLVDKDQEAFKQLYDLYKNEIYRTCFYIVFDKQLAQDLLQETFVLAYRHIGKVNKPESLKAWLTTIAIRQSRRFIQKEKKNTWIEWQDHLTQAVSDTQTPEELLIANEQKASLLEALASLSMEARSILTLFYYNQLKIKEIAAAMDQPEGTIKWKLHQARKQLLHFFRSEINLTVTKEANV